MDRIPLIDIKTGHLSFEWVYCYAKENNCSPIEAFSEGMKQLGDLYVNLKEFQQKFLETPHQMARDYEDFCAGQTALDKRMDARLETPNKNARTIPVISS